MTPPAAIVTAFQAEHPNPVLRKEVLSSDDLRRVLVDARGLGAAFAVVQFLAGPKALRKEAPR